MQLSKNSIITILLIVCFALAAALIYSQMSGSGSSKLTKESVIEKTVAFINENLLSEGTVAEQVGDIEEVDFYKFKIKIGENEFFSYVTKDGKTLLPQEGIDMTAEIPSRNSTAQKPVAKTCEEVKKEENPVLEAFVVSYCPFGTQMQRILNEIVKEIPSFSENIKIRYMGSVQNGKVTAMHGEKEAQENLRQICLREEQADKFYSYLSCFLKSDDSEGCQSEAQIDKDKLSQCMEDSSRGISYAEEDFNLQNTYQVTGSPTLIINGERISEFNFGGRTAEAVKTVLCCGFASEPDSCGKTLSEEQAATGFSETYSTKETKGGACE